LGSALLTSDFIFIKFVDEAMVIAGEEVFVVHFGDWLDATSFSKQEMHFSAEMKRRVYDEEAICSGDSGFVSCGLWRDGKTIRFL
jgi:hypothetical protein